MKIYIFAFDSNKVILLHLNQHKVTFNCAPHYTPAEPLLMTKIHL